MCIHSRGPSRLPTSHGFIDMKVISRLLSGYVDFVRQRQAIYFKTFQKKWGKPWNLFFQGMDKMNGPLDHKTRVIIRHQPQTRHYFWRKSPKTTRDICCFFDSPPQKNSPHLHQGESRNRTVTFYCFFLCLPCINLPFWGQCSPCHFDHGVMILTNDQGIKCTKKKINGWKLQITHEERKMIGTIHLQGIMCKMLGFRGCTGRPM